MAALQIRDVPEDLHDRLRQRAAAEGMSLSAWARRELERAAGRPTLAAVLDRARNRSGTGTVEEVLAALHEARDARVDGGPSADTVALIREDRDRR